MVKHFSIIRQSIGRETIYFFRGSDGPPFVAGGEEVIGSIEVKFDERTDPEKVREAMERLRKKARELGIPFVINLDRR